MTWWSTKKDELPEKLRKYEKPEDVIAALDAGELSKTEAADVKAKLAEKDTALASTQSEFEKAKARIAELEAAAPVERRNNDNSNEPTNWFADPDKAFNERLVPMQNLVAQSGAMSAKLATKATLGTIINKTTGRPEVLIFNKYEEEIAKYVGNMPQASWVNPQSWMYAFTLVKGMHMDEIATAGRDNSDFFGEVPSSGSLPPEPPKDKLTDEEAKMCDRMHWNKDDYLKSKKARPSAGA